MYRLPAFARSVLACLLVLPLAVCGDSGTEPEPDAMTQEEFEAFVEVLVVLSELDYEGIGSTASAAASAPVPQTFPVVDDFPCPEGGSIHLDGSVTVDEETGFFGVSATETHQACRATAPSSGLLFELNGAPNLSIEAQLQVSETEFSFSASQNGGIQWETGESSGTCTIDLDIALTFTEETETDPDVSVEGTVCGRAVDQLVS